MRGKKKAAFKETESPTVFTCHKVTETYFFPSLKLLPLPGRDVANLKLMFCCFVGVDVSMVKPSGTVRYHGDLTIMIGV